MSSPATKLVWPTEQSAVAPADPQLDRRLDVDEKQAWVAELLRQHQCDGLLVLEPENFIWLTSGGIARGILDPAAQPALFFNPQQRCLVCSNVDSQRLFDEEMDGLGFQLKEWPWYRGRAQLLADLCQGRKVACDRPFGDCTDVGAQLRQRRRTMGAYERACFRSLGGTVAHALEAVCRNLVPHQSEREAAGQLGHRLLHRGVFPLAISVLADGRSRTYRQGGFTSTPIRRYCVLTTTARKYGLFVTASRTMSFGPPDEEFRKEHEAACKIAATYVGATWADAVPKAILNTGRHVYQLAGYEHEWRLCPQGHIIGRAAVELALTPDTDELLQTGWTVTWRASVGAALSCDTYLITEHGPEIITPAQAWPLMRIRFHGVDILQPCPLEK
jgi:Xaa-Pro aminopeptidase